VTIFPNASYNSADNPACNPSSTGHYCYRKLVKYKADFCCHRFVVCAASPFPFLTSFSQCRFGHRGSCVESGKWCWWGGQVVICF